MNLPRFAGLSPSSQAASEAKRRTRGRDTRPELLLRRELWRRGYRYRIHARDLPGRPDLIFRGARVAVFCDGDFWHGRDWTERREKLQAGANGAYWIAKIESNMRRDLRTNELLRELGWLVLRFWENDIRKNLEAVCDQTAESLLDAAQTSTPRRLHTRGIHSERYARSTRTQDTDTDPAER